MDRQGPDKTEQKGNVAECNAEYHFLQQQAVVQTHLSVLSWPAMRLFKNDLKACFMQIYLNWRRWVPTGSLSVWPVIQDCVCMAEQKGKCIWMHQAPNWWMYEFNSSSAAGAPYWWASLTYPDQQSTPRLWVACALTKTRHCKARKVLMALKQFETNAKGMNLQ